MKTRAKIIITGAAILFLAGTGCEDMKDTYYDFVKDGETVYVVKAESITTRGGKERMELSWLLFTDPNVSRYQVSWNNERESVEGAVQKTENVDTVTVMFPFLEEGTYQFDVIMYDKYGNSSVKTSAIGRSYGKRFQESLLDRAYRKIERKGDAVEIEWTPVSEEMTEMVEVEYEYTDKANNLIRDVLPGSETISTLADFPAGGSFRYRTGIMPEIDAIDTFYTEYQTMILD